MQPKPEWYSDDFTAKYMYGHSRSRKLGEKFRTGDEENHDIPWKMYLFMLKKKLLQTFIVCTEKASRLLTGQQASKITGIFVGTVI